MVKFYPVYKLDILGMINDGPFDISSATFGIAICRFESWNILDLKSAIVSNRNVLPAIGIRCSMREMATFVFENMAAPNIENGGPVCSS